MYYYCFIIWCILLLITQIIFLVKSIKTKHNKDWSILFTIISSSILSSIIFWSYSCIIINNLEWGIILILVIFFSAIVSYAIMLLISIILKALEVNKFKKLNIKREKIDRKTLKKAIISPLLLIILLSCSICVIDYSIIKLQRNYEIKKYNETKVKEIQKMVDFINNKYDLNFNSQDCNYYRAEDYSQHTDILGNGTTYNIPYIAAFSKDNKKITVVDRKGIISDNAQLKDINYYIGDYFSNIVGSKIDYVQVRKTYNGNIEDDIINSILQNGFNKKITQNNINEFLDEILKEEDLELLFYVKDTENRVELINTLTSKLSYLKDYKNIERVMIYIYDSNENLIVNNIEKELTENYKLYNTSDDYYDSYKFGYYYVPNDYEYYASKDETFNTFIAALYYNLDRGYGPSQGNKTYTIINNWYIYIN